VRRAERLNPACSALSHKLHGRRGSPAPESPAAAAPANLQETPRRSLHANSLRRVRFKTPHANPRGHDGTCKASNSRRPGLSRDRLTHGLALRSGDQTSTIPRVLCGRQIARPPNQPTFTRSREMHATPPHAGPALAASVCLLPGMGIMLLSGAAMREWICWLLARFAACVQSSG
jgi:hypothetical protein